MSRINDFLGKKPDFKELEETRDIKTGAFRPEQTTTLPKPTPSLDINFSTQQNRNTLKAPTNLPRNNIDALTNRISSFPQNKVTVSAPRPPQNLKSNTDRRGVSLQRQQERKSDIIERQKPITKQRAQFNEDKKLAKERLKIIEPLYKEALRNKDSAKVKEYGTEVARLKTIANPFATGLLLEASPVPLNPEKVLERTLQAPSGTFEGMEQRPGYGAGALTTNIGKSIVQYGAINKLIKGTKLGSVIAGKIGSTFAADQAADILVDRIVQAPDEWIPLIKGEKGLWDTFKTVGGNTVIDAALNLVIGGLSDKKSFKEMFDSKEVKNLKKVVNELGPEGETIVKNRIKSLDPQQADILRKAIDTKVDAPLSPSTQTFTPSAQSKFGVDDLMNKRTVELYGEKYQLTGLEGNNYKAIDPVGQEVFLPKVIVDEQAPLTAIQAKNLSVRQKANELLADSSLSEPGQSFNEGFLKSELMDSGVQRGEAGDFVPARPKIVKGSVQDLLDRNLASSEQVLRNKLQRIVDGTETASDLDLKNYIEQLTTNPTGKGRISQLLNDQPVNANIAKEADSVMKQTPDEALKVSDMAIENPDEVKTLLSIDGLTPTAKQGPDGMVERGYSKNIRTDENIAKEASESFDKDPEFYKQLANETTLDKAMRRFNAGYEKALDDFERTKNNFTPDNVVLSKLLANEAANRGDLVTMRRVLSDTAQTLTQAGQYSQAARILRESNDPASIAAYINKELDRLNNTGVKRYGKKWDKLELTDDELGIIAKFGQGGTEQQKKELFEQLYNRISDRIPTSRMEKFDAWRRIAMLTNPKTHIRNITGNALMAGVKKMADSIATGMEKFIPKDLRTKSLKVSKDVRKAAEQNWEANKEFLKDGSRWEIFGLKSPFAEKRIFDSNLLESINQFSKNTLEGEDIFFLKRHYVRDLAGFMEARGLKEPTQEAMDYALRRAQEATFREANAFATAINKMKGSRGFGKLVDAAMPFTKTPANILKTGIDYSPIGVVNSIFKLANSASPEVFIETLSKGLTGSALSLTGFYMAKNGLVRGDYKKDASEESLLSRAGILPNSINLPSGSYTIDWAQPAAIPFFMGVAFAEELDKEQKKAKYRDENVDYLDATMKAFVQSGETLINSSMLRGVKDIFGGYGSTTEKIIELPLSYLEQGIPTVLGQMARTVDNVKRQRDYSSMLEGLKTRTLSKIPGASQALPPKFDILGEEQTYGEGLGNFFQQFLSPGYVGTKKGDDLTKEILRLYNEVGAEFLPRMNTKGFSNNGVKYTFTNREKSDFQKAVGTYTSQALERLFDSVSYQNATDDEKAKMVKEIDTESYEKAKNDYLLERGIK